MKSKSGFTIIELAIAIVVIGILAAITVVGYSGYQKRTSITALRSALSSATTSMELESLHQSTPTDIPATASSANNITLDLVLNEYNYYGNLNRVQNGVLLSQICQDLINEGHGRGQNAGGGTDNYITGCGNWNAGSMQVTGWTSKVFSTPLTSTTLPNYASSIPPGDGWHPNRQDVTANFYLELHSRFVSQGGKYPIESFWDYWANDSNGGVKHENLPANPKRVIDYCIEGYHHNYPEDIWHAAKDESPKHGSC